MASTLPLVGTRTVLRTKPLELWHLLSLDAPTVAVLWTWFIAASVHIALPLTSLLAMGLVVWMLYAADRLLDARLLHGRLRTRGCWTPAASMPVSSPATPNPPETSSSVTTSTTATAASSSRASSPYRRRSPF